MRYFDRHRKRLTKHHYIRGTLKSVSGENEVKIEDSAGVPFNKIEIAGNTFQKTYSGYNPFHFKDFTGSKTDSDGNVLSWEMKNGIMTINGKSNIFTIVSINNTHVIDAPTFKAGTYTVTPYYYKEIGDVGMYGCDWRFSDPTSTNVYLYSGNSGVATKTFENDFKFVHAQIYIKSNVEFKDYKYAPAIFEGTYTSLDNLPPYEPYVGGIPSPNPGQVIKNYTTEVQDVDLTTHLMYSGTTNLTFADGTVWTAVFENPIKFSVNSTSLYLNGIFNTGNSSDEIIIGSSISNIESLMYNRVASGDGTSSSVYLMKDSYPDGFYVAIQNTSGLSESRISELKSAVYNALLTISDEVQVETTPTVIPAYPQEIVNANNRSIKTYKFSVSDFTWDDGMYGYITTFEINPSKSYKIYVKDKDESISTDLIASIGVSQDFWNAPYWDIRNWDANNVAEVKGYDKLYYNLGYDGQPTEQQLQTYLNRYDLIVEELDGMSVTLHGDNLFNQDDLLTDSNFTKGIYNGVECIKVRPTTSRHKFSCFIPKGNNTFSFNYASPKDRVSFSLFFYYEDGTEFWWGDFNSNPTPSEFIPYSRSKTTTQNIVAIEFRFFSINTYNEYYFNDIMVNVGAKKDYVPYFREEIAIPQSVEVDGATVDLNMASISITSTTNITYTKTDYLTVDRLSNKVLYHQNIGKKTLNSSNMLWHIYTSGKGIILFFSRTDIGAAKNYNPIVTNKYLGYTGVHIASKHDYGITTDSVWWSGAWKCAITIHDIRFDNLEDFLADLDQNPLEIEYGLAEEITHDITSTELGQALLRLCVERGLDGTLRVESELGISSISCDYYSQESEDKVVLTVSYQNEAGEALMDDKTHNVRRGSKYQIVSPQIDGYEPTEKEAFGVADGDLTIILKYKEVSDATV